MLCVSYPYSLSSTLPSTEYYHIPFFFYNSWLRVDFGKLGEGIMAIRVHSGKLTSLEYYRMRKLLTQLACEAPKRVSRKVREEPWCGWVARRYCVGGRSGNPGQSRHPCLPKAGQAGCGTRGWRGSKDKLILLALHRSPPLTMTPLSHDGHCIMAAFWFSCRVLLWSALTQCYMGRESRKCGSGSAKTAQEVSSTLDPWQSFLFLFPQVAA